MKGTVGVIRVDRGHTHGWQARICRHGEKYSRFFSDALNGGKRRAREAAVSWRRKMERELPEALPSGRRVA